MSLPKIDLPIYKVFLSSQDREIKFRPFVVKEEKILLMALESGEITSVVDAVKQVVASCVLDNIDIDDMPLYELEKIFLHLRARSISEIVEITYICQNDVAEKKCKNEMALEVDLLKTVVESKPVLDKIMLTDVVGIKLKYPSISVSSKVKTDGDDFENMLSLIEHCTDYLFDEAQVYQVTDMQEGEFRGFIENLTQEQFASIKTFFDNVPKIVYDANLTCGKCGADHQIHLEGLSDFFE
jgi:hypothetical protein